MDNKKIVKIQLFGGLQIKLNDDSYLSIKGKKNAALFARLVEEESNILHRNAARSFLWSTRSEEQKQQSLRQSLSSIRSSLSPLTNCPIKTEGVEFLSLDLTGITVDISQHRKAVENNELEIVLELYKGEFLCDLEIMDPAYINWIRERRQWYLELYIDALIEKLSNLQLRITENRELGKELALKLLNYRDDSEIAHRVLMLSYFLEGDKGRALRQFHQCRISIEGNGLENRDGSGMRLSPETISLHESIRTHEPGDFSNSQVDTTGGVVYAFASNEQTYGLSIAIIAENSANQGNWEQSLVLDFTDQIIIGLSKFKWMSVSPRTVKIDYQEAIDFHDICINLNVRYIIDVNITRKNKRAVLSVKLIDGFGASGSEIAWAESFEFDTQKDSQYQDVLAKVICRADIKLRTREINRVVRLKPNKYSAYDCVIRAIANISQMTPEAFESAEQLFDQAINLDPDFAAIYTWKIYWEIFDIGQGWATNPEEEIIKANLIAKEALLRDPDDAIARAMLGHFESFINHNFYQAKKLLDQALELNPYSAFVWLLSSLTSTYISKPDEALEKLARIESLCPIEPQQQFFFNLSKCIAYTFKRNYEEGVKWGYRVIGENSDFTNGYKPLICCLGHLGKTDEAQLHIKKLMELEPSFSVSAMGRRYPFRNENDRAHYLLGLKLAGL